MNFSRKVNSRYQPSSLDEIQDYLSTLVTAAPSFVFKDWWATDRTIDSEFAVLGEALQNVREELGEARYAKAVDLAARAKALFVDDPGDDNGKTVIGCHLLWDIDDIIEESYKEQPSACPSNDEGQVTED
ncbi:hypothetical protein [Sphingomonas sp. RIT328]|uniref:hypothetical protein n=1 Tax=Sphingomonas sp. RIT328 TaxID=1470591 RepID=UPI00055C95C1|nr:hypothetical protein [Sphingomonas sp. RIT328]